MNREEAIQELNSLDSKLQTLSNPMKIKGVKRKIKEIETLLKTNLK